MEVIKNRVYKHFKGNYYIVLDFAIHSETQQNMVLYRALYDNGALYARPYELFVSEVDHEKYPNIKQKYRFELCDIENKNI